MFRVFTCFAFIFCIATSNSFAITKKKFDFVVGVNGDFKAAITAAANAASSGNRFYIFFPDGEYNIGALTGDANQKTTFSTSNVSFIGQSTDKTVLFNKSINEGISITATLYFNKADNLYLQDLTIYNKANYGNTASYQETGRHVAVQEQGNKYIYKNVKLLSTQDTYYTKGTRTYWETGEIHGTTDYICGSGDVFFEQCRFFNLKKSAMTAPSTTSAWGYVFNSCTIDGNVSGYTLGRSWNTAKAVFINTTMKQLPDEKGWGDPMNSVPQVFAEYKSKNASGGLIDLSKRRTDYTKDGNTVKLNPVLTDSQAAQYTVENVLGGTDQWRPKELTKQLVVANARFEGNLVRWDANENALCWVVFKNGKYLGNTTVNSFDVSSTVTGDLITVRAANAMGGLGASSAAVVKDPRPYYAINATALLGGSIIQTPPGTSLAEGSSVSFVASPTKGWYFTKWSGDYSGTELTWKINSLNGAVTLQAAFMPSDKETYQAETGTLIKEAIVETKNAGFTGDAYINLDSQIGSGVEIPVYADSAHEAKVTITYANGAAVNRQLGILVNGKMLLNSVDFEPTGAWTSWGTKTVVLLLPKGISSISLVTINANDGPNIDKITLEPKTTKVIPKAPQALKHFYDARSKTLHIETPNAASLKVEIYTTNGKKSLSFSNQKEMALSSLSKGVYALRITQNKESYSGLITLF